MLRCAQLGLTVEMLRNMTPGMVTDMMIEKDNDHHDYPIIATQEDFDNF